jgi:hypothetical protein
MNNRIFLFFALVAWWLTVAVFATEQTVAMTRSAGEPRSWGEILPIQLVGWLIWVPLSVFLIALVRRFPLNNRGKLVSVLVIGGGVSVCCAAKAVVVLGLNPYVDLWYDAPVSPGTIMLDSLRSNTVLGWLIVGVAHAIHFYDHDVKNQLLIAELEAGLNKTHLEALAARLNPHFMFNTLNAIMELVHLDPNKAESMLAGLSSILRRSLDPFQQLQVTLREELACIDQYVDIQRVRFDQRLTYQTQIEPEALDCLVPSMLLQPLIENAIEHGVASSSKPSVVTLSGRLTNQSLILTVESPNVTAAPARDGFGIGLSATKARLRLIYGNNQTLSVGYKGTDRVLVTIFIVSTDFLLTREKPGDVDIASGGGSLYG